MAQVGISCDRLSNWHHLVASCSLLFQILRLVQCSSTNETKCLQNYRQDLEMFEILSGAIVVPGLLAQNDTEDDSMHYVEMAETQALSCFSFGAFYWRINAKLSKPQITRWVASMPPGKVNGTSILEHLDKWFLGDLAQGVSKIVRSGLCAPTACLRTNMVRELIPLWIGRWMLRFARHFEALNQVEPWTPVPPEGAGFGGNQARQLGAWSFLQYDFMIVGVDACGTTSLHRNLAEHPDIAFSKNEEDGILQGTAYLPLKYAVEEFNSRWTDPSIRGKLRGIYTANLYGTPYAVAKVAMKNPLPTLLMVACDPVSRFETLYDRHAADCADEVGVRNVTWSGKCLGSLEEAIRDERFNRRARIAPHLQRLAHYLSPQLFVVHQAHLREDKWKAFHALAEGGLKLKPQLWKRSDTRWNSIGARRSSELCQNSSLLLRLKRHLAEDVSTVRRYVEAFSYRLPEEVLLGHTRCDRIESAVVSAKLDCYPKRLCEI